MQDYYLSVCDDQVDFSDTILESIPHIQEIIEVFIANYNSFIGMFGQEEDNDLKAFAKSKIVDTTQVEAIVGEKLKKGAHKYSVEGMIKRAI